jgi:intracellular septation protein A
MTDLLDAPAFPPQPTSLGAVPSLRCVVRRTAVSLLVAVLAPAVLFWLALVLYDVFVGVSVALAWVVGAMCWRWARGQDISRLLLLSLLILTLRTTFTLVTGNTFVYFVQPVFSDAFVAVLFLGSLFTSRPLVARLAPDFYPIDLALAARPRVVRLFRRLTLLWGLVVVAKGTTTLWLLLALPTVDFVVVKSSAIIALTLMGVAATLALSTRVGRQEGLVPASA